jgi:lipid-binding SYLF domain-containing protein
VGADLTDHVIVLSSDDAVKVFSGCGQLTIGGEIDVRTL